MLEHFKGPVHQRGGRVFAGDVDALAPTLYLADEALRLVPVTSSQYLSSLVEVVRRHSIRLLIPTIDTELLVLAEGADHLQHAGCTPLISDPTLVQLCNDKWTTTEHFAGRDFATPRSWLPDELPDQLPEKVFVKPRGGSASKNARAVRRADLSIALACQDDAIVQEQLTGREITIDALFDLRSRPLHYVPRVRIRTMAGESIQGVTIDDAPFRKWLRRLLDELSSLGARGPITLQAFLTDERIDPVLVEVNPRFGGGFPLAAASGGCYAEWILQMLEGAPVEQRLGDYVRNRYMTRYYCERFTDDLPW